MLSGIGKLRYGRCNSYLRVTLMTYRRIQFLYILGNGLISFHIIDI